MAECGHTVAIIQARMTSTRLAGKVMLGLGGAPMFAQVVRRARRIPGVDAVCLAVPEGAAQAPLVAAAEAIDGLSLARGPEDDVLRRYAEAAEACQAEVVVRVTSDCPFIDPGVSGAVVAARHLAGADCARTAIGGGWPLGLDTEVFTMDALRAADREARDAYEREHVAPFFWRRPERFATVWLDGTPDRRHWRLTVDTAADYDRAKAVYDTLAPTDPDFGLAALDALFAADPSLLPRATDTA